MSKGQMNADIQKALVAEAKKKQLAQRVAARKAEMELAASFIEFMSTAMSDAQRGLKGAQKEMDGIEQGGASVTDDFGHKGKTLRALDQGREAGKRAVIDYVRKTDNPDFRHAVSEYESAESTGMLNGEGMLLWYRERLMEDGLIDESTWDAHCQWLKKASDDQLGL